jgi:hypothetical protein
MPQFPLLYRAIGAVMNTSLRSESTCIQVVASALEAQLSLLAHELHLTLTARCTSLFHLLHRTMQQSINDFEFVLTLPTSMAAVSLSQWQCIPELNLYKCYFFTCYQSA